MEDLLLTPRSRLIHIGPPKTGSTAIQSAFFAHAEQLRDHGVTYAGGGQSRAREAGWAILGGRAPVGRPAPTTEAWYALQREMRDAGDLRVFHSNEDYARADAGQAARIIRDLGGDRPHVLYVVRPLVSLVPSYWAERVKAREGRTYEQWLDVILAEKSGDWQWHNFHHPQDVAGIVDRWGRVVGRDNMTIVVLSRPRIDLLPTSIEALLGLPIGQVQLDEAHANRSLSYAETELVRRVNLASVNEKWSGDDYRRYVQIALVRGLRRGAAGGTSTPVLPAQHVERMAELAQRQADAVASAGVRVIGDLDELREVRTPDGEPTLHPPALTGQPVGVDLETAAHAVIEVIHRAQQVQRGIERSHARHLKSRDRDLVRRAPGVTVAQTSTRQLLRTIAIRVRRRLSR